MKFCAALDLSKSAINLAGIYKAGAPVLFAVALKDSYSNVLQTEQTLSILRSSLKVLQRIDRFAPDFPSITELPFSVDTELNGTTIVRVEPNVTGVLAVQLKDGNQTLTIQGMPSSQPSCGEA